MKFLIDMNLSLIASSAASWEYGARSDWDATISSATYTSWGFNQPIHSTFANRELRMVRPSRSPVPSA
jgi:hypothetical protein